MWTSWRPAAFAISAFLRPTVMQSVLSGLQSSRRPSRETSTGKPQAGGRPLPVVDEVSSPGRPARRAWRRCRRRELCRRRAAATRAVMAALVSAGGARWHAVETGDGVVGDEGVRLVGVIAPGRSVTFQAGRQSASEGALILLGTWQTPAGLLPAPRRGGPPLGSRARRT
jgi:hypothetical protein